MRRPATLAVTVLAAVVLAACGGSDDAGTDTADTVDAAEAAAQAESETETETEAADDVADTVPPTTVEDILPADPPADDASAPAGAIPVALVEWAVDAPTALPAGAISFEVTNGGDFPHHLAVARGTSYEELPLLPNGAVDEAALGADYLGRTDNLQGGGSTTFDIELEPGNYVLFCNISAGPNSHAAQGQVLSVTVG